MGGGGGGFAAASLWRGEVAAREEGLEGLGVAGELGEVVVGRRGGGRRVGDGELRRAPRPGAAREEEMYYGLGLDELYRAGDGSRPLRLFMCSVFERRGYLEGFQWLGDQL